MSGALIAWPLCGLASLLWFAWLSRNHRYRTDWQRAADYGLAFLLGPLGLIFNALIALWQWRVSRWRVRP